MADPAQNEIIFSIKVPGAAEAAQAMGLVAGSTKGAGESIKAASDAAKKASESIRPFTESTRRAGEAMDSVAKGSARGSLIVGSFGNALSKASPDLDSFASAATRASSTIQNMTFLLGGGAGIAAGGMLLLVSTVAEKIGLARQKSDEFAKSQSEAAKATEEFYKGLKAEQLALRDTANAWAMNLGKTRAVVDLEDQLAAAQKNVAAIGGARKSLGGGVTLVNTRAVAAEAEVGRLQRELAKARANPHYGEHSSDTSTAAGMAEFNRETAVASSMQAQADSFKGPLASAPAFQRSQLELDKSSSELRLAQQKQAISEEMQVMRNKEREIVRLAHERDREVARVDEAIMQRDKMVTDSATAAWQGSAAVGIQSISAMAKGQRVGMRQIVSSIGDVMVAEGTRALFEGLTINANPFTPGLGVPLMTIGAEEIAAGIALGAGSRLFGGRGGSAPGGPVPQGSGQTYWDGSKFVRGAPYSPVGYSQSSRGEFGNSNVTINLPTQIRATGEDGVNIHRAITQAQREGKIPRALSPHDTM